MTHEVNWGPVLFLQLLSRILPVSLSRTGPVHGDRHPPPPRRPAHRDGYRIEAAEGALLGQQSARVVGEDGARGSAEELLPRVARGDRDAFRALYDCLGDRVFGLAHSVVRDAAVAQSVALEAFVEAWSTAPRFGPQRGDATSWLLSITHRCAVHHVRSGGAPGGHDGAAAPGESTMAGDAVTEQVAAGDGHPAPARDLDRAVGLQDRAIELAYFCGNTYHEIAALLEVPPDTAAGYLREGLIRLREPPPGDVVRSAAPSRWGADTRR